MIDLALHFCVAGFQYSKGTEAICGKIQTMWTLVVMGPPDYPYGDQGTVYVSREMEHNCEAAEITLIETPIGTPRSKGTEKRYRATLRES